ncbi:MAG: hypothetical protein WCY41_03205 [Candidatus Micrarchaeia archaeon]
MRKIFALIALAVLLFGCTGNGVPQEKYDALSASCEKAKADAASSLAGEMAKTGAANSRLSACTEEKQSLEELLTVREQENGELREEKAVLDSARAKMALAEQYNITMKYYLEAFGPGKVPNTLRLKKIDTQASSLNDSAIMGLWSNVKNCQGISGCDDAKEKFTAYIGGKITLLKLEAAAIVGKGQ